jgi:hypothetical protein
MSRPRAIAGSAPTASQQVQLKLLSLHAHWEASGSSLANQFLGYVRLPMGRALVASWLDLRLLVLDLGLDKLPQAAGGPSQGNVKRWSRASLLPRIRSLLRVP